MPRARQIRLLLVSLALLLFVAACTPSSPEEQIAATRGQYTAELVSFRVEQIPDPSAETAAEASGDAAEAAAADGEAEDGEVAIEVPDHLATNLVNNLYFDILVSTTAAETLSTLTVDLTHAAATQEEKRTYRLPLDVSAVVKGSGEQITATLENVEDFEEGDLFAVEVRTSVSDEDRSEYVEFSG